MFLFKYITVHYTTVVDIEGLTAKVKIATKVWDTTGRIGWRKVSAERNMFRTWGNIF